MKKKVSFKELYSLGELYDLELHYPPFDGYTDECFFDIDEFKDTPSFQTFISAINGMDIPYEYAKRNGCKKIYLTVKMGDMYGFKRLPAKGA